MRYSLVLLPVLWLACVGDNPTDSPAAQPDASASSGGSSSGGASSGGLDGGGSSGGLTDAQADTGVTCTAPETACGSTCANLASDDAHCGRCDRACGDGSTCSNNRCSVRELASGLAPMLGLSIAGTKLVFQSDRVYRCTTTGCATGPVPLFTDDFTLGAVVTARDDMAYFFGKPSAASGSVKLLRASLSDATPKQFPTNINTGTAVSNIPNGFVADAREFVVSTPYRLYRCFAASCTNFDSVLKNDETPQGVAMNDTKYVWIRTNGTDAVLTCARPAAGVTTYGTDCGETTSIASTTNGRVPIAVAVVGDDVYWTDFGSGTSRILTCNLNASCGTNPTVLVDGEAQIDDLAADASGVYWVDNSAGLVRSCRDRVAGCPVQNPPETLADGLTTVNRIVLDDAFAYVSLAGSGANGKLARVAK
jgi:hypothetical protein